MLGPLGRPVGDGWLVLIGGGEFSFGDTLEADAAWLDLAYPDDPASPDAPPADPADAPHVGFIPAASGSVDYGHHFADYLEAEHGRVAELIPIYRSRDARRGRNLERIAECAAVYLGGGVTDHLLEALEGQPAVDALLDRLRSGGVVVAIAGAAQVLGAWARSIQVGSHVPALGWLPGGVVEPNFDPGHDRRLRQLLAQPGVTWGLGLAPGAAVLLGPDGEVDVVGDAWLVEGADGPLQPLDPEDDDAGGAGGDGGVGDDEE